MYKVLHVVDGLHPQRGGVASALLGIASLFEEASISYKILSIGDNPSNLPANTIGFPIPNGGKHVLSRSAIKWFSENHSQYEIIYFHSIWHNTLLYLMHLTLKENQPYCISPHGSLDPFDLQKKKLFKKALGLLFVNKLLINAKYIICTSQIEKEALSYFGEKVDNAIVLPLPVDYTLLGKSGKKDNFKSKYSISNNQIIFLFLSRINYKKGLNEFINILSDLIIENKINKKLIKFIIAGDDRNNPYADSIKSLVESKELGEVTVFTGLLTGREKADAYKAADVFVLPSKNENFGLAIIESLQTGTPVLISKNVYIYKDLFHTDNLRPGWLCNESLSDLKEVFLTSYNDIHNPQKQADALYIGQKYLTSNLKTSYLRYFK